MKRLTRDKALKEVFPIAAEFKSYFQDLLPLFPELKSEFQCFDTLNNRLLAHKDSVENSSSEYVSKEVQKDFEDSCSGASLLSLLIERKKP